MRKPACSPGSRVRFRANIKLSKALDKSLNDALLSPSETPQLLGVLTQSSNELRVIDLFAGAGGMGLGFLMAGNQKRGFRIIYSAEKHPVYLSSLEKNYKFFADNSTDRLDNCCPSEYVATDLEKACDRNAVTEAVTKAGGVDVLIGGSPCQGFSPSNRKAWNPENPYNKLVDIFVECAVELVPKVILIENVQGILWTPHSSKGTDKKLSVVDYVSKKLTMAGYILFPAVLDAVWYGVPQHRNRFFLLGLHKDLGYTSDFFGDWGAFPAPTHGPMGKYDYVTVKEAIADLPEVGNGENTLWQDYNELTEAQLEANPFLEQMREMSPKGVIEGHIVSKKS